DKQVAGNAARSTRRECQHQNPKQVQLPPNPCDRTADRERKSPDNVYDRYRICEIAFKGRGHYGRSRTRLWNEPSTQYVFSVLLSECSFRSCGIQSLADLCQNIQLILNVFTFRPVG